MKIRTTILALAFIGAATIPATASPIEWQFDGMLTGITDPWPLAGIRLPAPLPVHTTLSFDSSAFDQCPSQPNIGVYKGNSATINVGDYLYSSGMWMEVNSFLAECVGAGPLTWLRLPEWRQIGGPVDDISRAIERASYLCAIWGPLSADGTLPTLLPSDPFRSTIAGSMSGTGTLTPVPEPSTLALLSGGLLAFCRGMRRRSRTAVD